MKEQVQVCYLKFVVAMLAEHGGTDPSDTVDVIRSKKV